MRYRLLYFVSAYLIHAFILTEVSHAQLLSPNGAFTLKNSYDDSVYLTGYYKDSLPDGVWTFYSYEQPFYFRTKYTYSRGLLNGEYLETIKGGTVISSGFYRDNRKHGTWKRYAYRGELIALETYRNDTLHGPYQKDGIYTTFTNGKMNGPVFFKDYFKGSNNYYSVDGQYEMDIRKGQWIFRRKNGNIDVVTYANDFLNGPFYTYTKWHTHYGFDSILEKGTYKNNLLDGPHTTYSYYYLAVPTAAHFFRLEDSFVNGMKNGHSILYHQNGAKMEEQQFENGKKIGVWYSRTDSGKLTTMHDYKDGNGYDSCIKWHYKYGFITEEYVQKKQFESGQYRKNYAGPGWPTKDTFYIAFGNRYFDHYEYQNSVVSEEYHYLNAKRNGRWYKKGVHDLEYKNGLVIKKTLPGLPREYFAEYGKQYFIEFAEDIDISGAITSEYAFNMEEPDPFSRRSLKTRYYPNFKHRVQDSVRLQKIVLESQGSDSLLAKGEVIFKCFVNAHGLLCSPILVKGLNPLNNAVALRAILNLSANSQEDAQVNAQWIYIRVRF